MSKKKKLYSAAGAAYYQIEPLKRMGQLKNFSQISSNLNKLAVNIQACGIEHALMKLGTEVEFESKPQKKMQVNSDIDEDRPNANELFGDNSMGQKEGRI